jgi:periodic tryptophan protein 2
MEERDFYTEATRHLFFAFWLFPTPHYLRAGHFYDMNVLDFSSNGQYIVTGGDDSKVKVWNTRSGFCFVTFKEHSAAVTGFCITIILQYYYLTTWPVVFGLVRETKLFFLPRWTARSAPLILCATGTLELLQARRLFSFYRYRVGYTFFGAPLDYFIFYYYYKLAIDVSGDIVCAGSLDTFEIFVWSVRTGHLVELLTGSLLLFVGRNFNNV